MKHRHVLRMLNDYVDGLLEEKLKTAVDQHLRSCPSCREEFEHVRTVRRTLDQLPSRPAPRGFLESVHQRLEKEQVPRPSVRKPWGHGRVVIPAGVAAFATAAIALVFVLNVMEPRKEGGEMVVGDRSDVQVEREMVVGDRSDAQVEREMAGPSHREADREVSVVEAPGPTAEADISSEAALKDEAFVKGEQKEVAGPEKRIAEEPLLSAAAKKAEPVEAPLIRVLLFKDAVEAPAEEVSEYGTYDVEEREASGGGVRISGVKSRDFGGDALEEDTKDKRAESLSVEASAASGAPEQVYAIVEQMVHENGGRIVAKEYGEKSTTPQSMVVEMPLQAVDIFVDELMRYGETGDFKGVIVPEELKNGSYHRQQSDGVETFAVKISFE